MLTEDSEAVLWINRKPVYVKDLLSANRVPDAFPLLGVIATSDNSSCVF